MYFLKNKAPIGAFCLFSILFIAFPAYPFDWEKCKKQGLGNANVFGVSTSSGQYTSSTGGCSALGKSDTQNKAQYFSENYNQIKSDAAKGSGEHLDTYLKISGCGKNGASSVKKNFRYIFSESKDDSFKKMNEVIEESKAQKN